MSLTIVSYAGFVILIFTALFMFIKNSNSLNATLIGIFSIMAALTSLFIGLAYDFGNAGLFQTSLWLVKLGGMFSYGVIITTLRLGIGFPHENKTPLLNIILIVFGLAIWATILFTDLYVVGVELQNGVFFRIEGKFYRYFSALSLAITIAAIVILLIRRRKLDNPIYKLQTMMIVVGTSFAVIIAIMTSIILPSFFHLFTLYPLTGLTALIMTGSFFYAIITYRMFDISTAIHKTAVFLLFSSIIGIVAGASFTLLHYLLKGQGSLLLSLVFIPVVAALFFLRDQIQQLIKRLLKRKTDYLEDLEKDLDAIDFSHGKEEVLKSFVAALSGEVGASGVTVVIENTIGVLSVVYSSASVEKIDIDKTDVFTRFLLNTHQSVILKTEIFTNPVFASYKVELLDLFMQTQAEAMIFFIEGTNIIGIVALTEKESMKAYDDYDYSVLTKVTPKLFVVMYYLRNIERQSVAITVEKELKFSEQIIHSVLRNMDTIDTPVAEFKFLNQFTTGLGGDYVDVIRIGGDKFLIVIGDIAGKGINASMSMIIIKSVIRTFIKEAIDFKTLIVRLNAFIKTSLPRGTFFAGVLMIYQQTSGTLYYVNCGVPVMYLYANNYRSVIEIQGEGKVLGFVKDISKFVAVKKTQLNPEDVLMISTDGMLESESLTGERFGKQRLSTLLAEQKEMSAQDLTDLAYEQFHEFVSGEINDDITLAVLKIKGKFA